VKIVADENVDKEVESTSYMSLKTIPESTTRQSFREACKPAQSF
jgi:hypothetical protein